MTNDLRLAVCLLLAALPLACAEGPVVRVVPLVAEDGYPRALTTLAGSALRVEVLQLEALGEGSRLYLWALSAAAWQPVGELVPGPNSLTGPAWETVETVLVTREGPTLGAAPSREVVFRGSPGQPLPFNGPGGPAYAALAKAKVSVVLEDLKLTAHVAGLPLVTAGTFYGVWLVGPPVAGGAAPAETFLGPLGDDDSELWGETLLALGQEILLTVELEAGVESRGSVVMRGKVYDPSAASSSSAAPAPSHQH